MSKVYHSFNVTDKKNLSIREAFDVALEILEDISTTNYKTWPKDAQLRLRDDSVNESGIKVYHFDVLIGE